MSRLARMCSGAFAVARPAWREAERLRRAMACAGTAADSAAARNRPRALVVTCLVAGTLALLAPAGDSQAQSRIDRLFSTPEQRAELDRLREHSSAGEAAAPTPEPPARETRTETERESPALAAIFNGIVVRGDVHRVAWIDGAEIPAGDSTPAGVSVESERTLDGRIRARLSLGPATTVLAPGQSIDADGKVRNGYERRPKALPAGTTGEKASGTRTPRGQRPKPGNGVR